ncbi:MAG: AAA family ATPase [Novosphingobium sp.]
MNHHSPENSSDFFNNLLKVSSLTREHLRKVVTAFIATGGGDHAAPFYRQGTGTINMLVLAMLSQIAEDKQNVIFAMEEAETAIPPYAQKRIVHELRKLSAQAIFTSHSPYVLEEFSLDETVIISRSDDGLLTRLRGAGRLCRERSESFLAVREGWSLATIAPLAGRMEMTPALAGPSCPAAPTHLDDDPALGLA